MGAHFASSAEPQHDQDKGRCCDPVKVNTDQLYGACCRPSSGDLEQHFEEVIPEVFAPSSLLDLSLDDAPREDILNVSCSIPAPIVEEVTQTQLPDNQVTSHSSAGKVHESSSSLKNMHNIGVFHRYGKSLWLFVVSLPVTAVVLVWALLSDYDCKDGKRNLIWFQWFYDFIYTFFGVVTAVTVFDVCYMSPGCSNWGAPFRWKFWLISTLVGISTCIWLNLFASHMDLYTSDVAWLFGKSNVIFASTCTTIAMLLCALWYTSGWEEKKFAAKSWFFVFVFAVWALAFYICNQLFVLGYIEGQQKLEDPDTNAFFTSTELKMSLYDYAVACFFGAVYGKLWTQAGHFIMSLIRESAPQLQKDRLYFTVVLWSELFNTVFGRMIFKEVHLDSLLLILMMKDSLVRVMDLTLRYNPTRMIRMAIRQKSDDSSRCMRFCDHVFALLLDVDLRLTLEFFLGFRSHSHHSHHLPDESYMSKRVHEVVNTHRHHISRANWRIAHIEATPEMKATEEEDPNETHLPGTLHWCGALRRWEEHHQLLQKYPVENYTNLDPGLRAIEWCARDESADDAPHEMHMMYWWHTYLCRPGLTREEIKSYLAWVWNCEEWTAACEYEAEALCDRMCFVQRNVRLNFVAIYLAKITSSCFGIIFLFTRSGFSCTLEAYGLEARPQNRELWIWCFLFCADFIEIVLIVASHWRNKLAQEGDACWLLVSHVLWDRPFMAMCFCISVHILHDAMIASYDLDF